MSQKPEHPEVGRELSLDDLKQMQRRVVVIAPPDRDILLTLWLMEINDEVAVFGSGKVNMSVINFVRDGTLVDDSGRLVKVYEYLGE